MFFGDGSLTTEDHGAEGNRLPQNTRQVGFAKLVLFKKLFEQLEGTGTFFRSLIAFDKNTEKREKIGFIRSQGTPESL